MKIFQEYTNQSIKRSKTLTRSLRLAIFIAVFALTIFGCIFESNVIRSQEMAEKMYGDIHVKLHGDFSKDQISTLENNINIEKIGLLRESKGEQVQETDFTLYLSEADENYNEMLQVNLLKGRMPRKSDEILIPLLVGKDLGVSIGENLQTTDADGNPHSYLVVGLLDYDQGSWEKESIAYTFEDGENLREESNEILIWYKNKRNTYKLTPQIVSALGYDYEETISRSSVVDQGTNSFSLQYNTFYLSSHFIDSAYSREMNFSFHYPEILCIGLLSLSLFFIFVIKTTFKVWENSQRREYGLLLSIGAKRSDIRKMILQRLFKIAWVPFCLGIIFGTVFSAVVLRIMTRYHILANQDVFSYASYDFRLYPHPLKFLITFLATVVVLIGSAIRPLREISKLNVIDALKMYQTSNQRQKVSSIRSRHFLSDLSKINSYQNRGKLGLCAFSLSLAFFFISLTLSLLSGLDLELTYDQLDEMENYQYKITYIHPHPFPEEFVSSLTNQHKYPSLHYRSNSFYVKNETANENEIFLDSYLEDYFPQYQEEMRSSQMLVRVIGVDQENYHKMIGQMGYSREEADQDNTGFIINRVAKDFTVAKKMQENTPVLKEGLSSMDIQDYPSDSENQGQNSTFTLNILGMTEDEDILGVPQVKNRILYITSMDTYLQLVKESQQDHTGTITEEVYFNANPDMTLQSIKALLSHNLSTRDIEVSSRETVNDFAYYSNRILYALLISVALVFTFMGLTQAYSLTTSLKQAKREEYTLYLIVGMDRKMLSTLSLKELHRMMVQILIFSLILLTISLFLAHFAYKNFSPLQIFFHMKWYILVLYFLLFYLFLRILYVATYQDLNLTSHSQMIS